MTANPPLDVTRARAPKAVRALLSVALVAPACTGPDRTEAEPTPAEDWVVIRFDDDRAMKLLLRTELRADRALRRAGAGSIDGNEVGQGDYDLYFAGQDHDEMWRVLRPIFAEAPVRWSRVELLDGLDDEDPDIIRG